MILQINGGVEPQGHDKGVPQNLTGINEVTGCFVPGPVVG
jgi:hypothetical protein